MYKVLVRLYVPMLDQQYDVWIPLNKRIYNVTLLLVKAIYDFSGGYYKPEELPKLYNKSNSQLYPINITVKEAEIVNGTEIILI